MNSLAIVNSNEWSAMAQMAEALVQSGFLPQSVNTPQKAVAIILAGRELGIGAWQALQTINVIQGKPTVSPQLMLALINQSGQLEDIAIDGDGKGCTVMMKRKGRQPHTETFTLEDAQRLNLAGKPNYKSQPAIMLRWRAVAACARVVFPDVILGLYTPDEMGADVVADDSGNMTVIDVQPEPVNEQPANGKGKQNVVDASKRLGANGERRVGQQESKPNVVRDWPFIFGEVRHLYAEPDDEKAKAHWWNGTVKKLIKDGAITDGMSDMQIVNAIQTYKRRQRAEAAKQAEADKQFAAI